MPAPERLRPFGVQIVLFELVDEFLHRAAGIVWHRCGGITGCAFGWSRRGPRSLLLCFLARACAFAGGAARRGDPQGDSIHETAAGPGRERLRPIGQTAQQIVRSPFALTTVTSAGAPSQGEVNVAGDYGTEVVVSPHLSDANNWFLMSKLERTVKIWERFAPSISTSIDEDDKRVKISVDFALATGVNAQPDGAYGAEVS